MTRVKLLLFAATILILAASVFSFVYYNNDFLIRKWNLPLDPPGFLDSRQFAWASEAYAQGYDPLIENPVNPRGHQLNYPRIWHLLFTLGINESHTNLIGTITAIIFFAGIGIFWFSKKFDNLSYFIMTMALLSPAVMLGLERSNIELVLFFILSLALTINYYSAISALFVFIFASILKLYPVFGFVYLLKENKKRFLILFLSALGVFIVYILVTLDDLKQVYHTTPKLAGSSFGLNIWWMGLKHKRFFDLPIPDTAIVFLQIISYVSVIMILAGALFFALRNKGANRFIEGKYLDAFRVGAGIYICCFIVISNHDYRLIFLIFTIPQLVSWLRDKGKTYSLVPLVTLSLMIFSLWSTFIMRFLGRKATFVMEEFSNWLILAGLLYLFFASLPEWLSGYLRRPFAGIKSFDMRTVSDNEK